MLVSTAIIRPLTILEYRNEFANLSDEEGGTRYLKDPFIKEEMKMTNDESKITHLITNVYTNYVNKSDASGYASMYTDQVLWSPPGGPDQTTRDGIERTIGGMFSKVTLSVEIIADEIEILNDFAWVAGTVNGINTNKESSEKIKFKFRGLWLLNKIGSNWKISRQIWNNKPV